MTEIEFMVCILAVASGLVGAFLFGCVIGLRRRVEALEEFIESIGDSLYR